MLGLVQSRLQRTRNTHMHTRRFGPFQNPGGCSICTLQEASWHTLLSWNVVARVTLSSIYRVLYLLVWFGCLWWSTLVPLWIKGVHGKPPMLRPENDSTHEVRNRFAFWDRSRIPDLWCPHLSRYAFSADWQLWHKNWQSGPACSFILSLFSI